MEVEHGAHFLILYYPPWPELVVHMSPPRGPCMNHQCPTRPTQVRPEMELLHERLLSSKHRVASGGSADLFFVPLHLAGVRGPRGAFVQAAFQYLRATWPHFDRTGGRNHLLLVTDDMGGCSLLLDPATALWLRNVTLLTLFGYVVCLYLAAPSREASWQLAARAAAATTQSEEVIYSKLAHRSWVSPLLGHL
jgi:hypothetical protein